LLAAQKIEGIASPPQADRNKNNKSIAATIHYLNPIFNY